MNVVVFVIPRRDLSAFDALGDSVCHVGGCLGLSDVRVAQAKLVPDV